MILLKDVQGYTVTHGRTSETFTRAEYGGQAYNEAHRYFREHPGSTITAFGEDDDEPSESELERIAENVGVPRWERVG